MKFIRRSVRLGAKLGVIGGGGFALYRFLESRRSSSQSADTSPIPMSQARMPSRLVGDGTPAVEPSVPVSVPGAEVTPDPDLVEPVMLTSVKGFDRNGDSDEAAPAKPTASAKPTAPPPAKKAAAKKAPAKKPSPPKGPASP